MRTPWRKLNESDLIKLGSWQKRWTQQLHVSWVDHEGVWAHICMGVFACCLLKLVCGWPYAWEARESVCTVGVESRRETAVLKRNSELSWSGKTFHCGKQNSSSRLQNKRARGWAQLLEAGLSSLLNYFLTLGMCFGHLQLCLSKTKAWFGE